MYLREEESALLQRFRDPNFAISSEDLFGILNCNISLQSTEVTVLRAQLEVQFFQEKLAL
jgi:hypothetical protein